MWAEVGAYRMFSDISTRCNSDLYYELEIPLNNRTTPTIIAPQVMT